MISTDCRFLPVSLSCHSRHSSRPSIATGRPFGEVLGAVLALRAPHRDVEVVGLVDPLAGGLVLAAGVARDPQAADSHAARKIPELGIAGQVPRRSRPC